VAGIVEAEMLFPVSLPGVLRVGKRVIKSIDPNQFRPRRLAGRPGSGRLAVRAGYGIFFFASSFFYLALAYFSPPFFWIPRPQASHSARLSPPAADSSFR